MMSTAVTFVALTGRRSPQRINRRHERMKAGVLALLESPDSAARRVVVQSYPELLHDHTDSFIIFMIGDAMNDGGRVMADKLRD